MTGPTVPGDGGVDVLASGAVPTPCEMPAACVVHAATTNAGTAATQR
jgi:hypothetical protein